MAFIAYEVVHVACIVCRLVALLWQTCHANDFVNAKGHARQKPLLTGCPLMKASFVQLKYWANKLSIHSRSISLATVLFYQQDPAVSRCSFPKWSLQDLFANIPCSWFYPQPPVQNTTL